MSIATGGTDIVGGAGGLGGLGGFGGGGLGGFGLVGLIGLNSFLGGRGGIDGGGLFPNGAGAIPGTTVTEQGVSDLKRDVAGVNTTVHQLGNEIAAALAGQTLGQTQEFMNLYSRLCDSDKANMMTLFNIQTQGLLNTQIIKDQAAANQIINQENFCAIKENIAASTDTILAELNKNVIDGLRAELVSERRGRDQREIEINVNQSNQQTQQVLQSQIQQQGLVFASALNSFADQFNRATNSIVNLGGVVASPQSNSQSNTKVNS